MGVKLPPRICLAFSGLIFLSLLILLFAWKLTCSVELEQDPRLLNFSQRGGNASLDPDLDPERVRVEVHYEVLCPDSRHFILNQLLPVYKDEEFRRRIQLQFVPYGKARSRSLGDFPFYSFDCQHGEPECRGNMLHACATREEGLSELTLAEYVGCMMQLMRERPEVGARKCASKFESVSYDKIHECFKDGRGHKYLFQYGEMTHSLKPSVSFIPTIVIDKSQKGQAEILRDFKGFLCRVLKRRFESPPAQC